MLESSNLNDHLLNNVSQLKSGQKITKIIPNAVNLYKPQNSNLMQNSVYKPPKMNSMNLSLDPSKTNKVDQNSNIMNHMHQKLLQMTEKIKLTLE